MSCTAPVSRVETQRTVETVEGKSTPKAAMRCAMVSQRRAQSTAVTWLNRNVLPQILTATALALLLHVGTALPVAQVAPPADDLAGAEYFYGGYHGGHYGPYGGYYGDYYSRYPWYGGYPPYGAYPWTPGMAVAGLVGSIIHGWSSISNLFTSLLVDDTLMAGQDFSHSYNPCFKMLKSFHIAFSSACVYLRLLL